MRLRVFACAAYCALACGAGVSAQQALPRGLGGVTLGMDRAAVTAAFGAPPGSAFGYRGGRDVSLLPSPNQSLIETPGNPASFLGRSWFQFLDDRLYIITVSLNPSRADHYSVFSKLREKYGAPDALTPEKAEWRRGGVIMALEKPLTLRYTDEAAFASLAENAAAERTAQEQVYQDFLDAL